MAGRRDQDEEEPAPDAPLVTFAAVIQKSPAKGGWTFVIWPQSAAFFGSRGLVKVTGSMDGAPFRGAFMALGNGTHKLAATASLLKRIGKHVGDTITVRIDQRLS